MAAGVKVLIFIASSIPKQDKKEDELNLIYAKTRHNAVIDREYISEKRLSNKV